MVERASVFLSQLGLYNFRNYPKAMFRFQPGLNVIYGANGAGKTNIVEAVSRFYDAGGVKSVPASAATGAKNPAGGWMAKMIIRFRDLSRSFQTGLSENPENRAFLTADGKKSSRTELRNAFPCLWLLQEDERLFSDDRSKVRKFFNRAIAQIYPAYAASYMNYETALRERLKILTGFKRREGTDLQLRALEKIIAEYADEVIRYRRYFLQDFTIAYTQVAEILTGEPKFTLFYECIGERCADQTEFAHQLFLQRETDAKAGRNLFGVHRVMWQAVRQSDGCEATHCSAGEQKAIMLTILCVLADLCRENAAARSVLILADDFAARLDEKRQARFLSYFFQSGAQVIVTGTDIPARSRDYELNEITPQSGINEAKPLELFA